METRQIGSSNVHVSVLGFGCGPSARLMVSDDAELQRATVQAALDAGISFFDTAAAYGDGASERNLGRTLKALGAKPLVSSKVLITEEQLGEIKKATLRSVEQSLQRLQLENLDSLILHNRVACSRHPGAVVGIGPLLSVDDILGPDGFADAIAELRSAGLVRVAGFTTFGGQPAAIDELLRAGVFDAINADFSAANPTAGFATTLPGRADYRSVIDRASNAGVSTMAIRVLGSGRLVGANRSQGGLDGNVISWCERVGGTAPMGAIRFALSKPGVATAVMGLSNPEHVKEAVQAAAAGPPSHDDLRQLAALLSAEDQWAPSSPLT